MQTELEKKIQIVKEKLNNGTTLGRMVPRLIKGKSAEELIEKTKFLDNFYNPDKLRLVCRLFCYINNITLEDQIPDCKYCGKHKVMFHHTGTEFREVCSKDCGIRFGETKNSDPVTVKNAAIKRKKTTRKKYNVDSVTQLESVKKQSKQTAIDNYGSLKTAYHDTAAVTIKEKYNVDNVSELDWVKDKKIETSRENYGTDYPWQSEKGKLEQKEGVKSKHKVDNVSQLDWVKEKKKETFLKNYDEDNIFKTKEFKEYLRNYLLENYGVENISQYEPIKEAKRLYAGYHFKYLFSSMLPKNQIKLFHLCQKVLPYPILEYPAYNRSIDIAIPCLSLAIEFDENYHYDKEDKLREEDIIRQTELEDQGWIVLRYREIPTDKKLIEDINKVI